MAELGLAQSDDERRLRKAARNKRWYGENREHRLTLSRKYAVSWRLNNKDKVAEEEQVRTWRCMARRLLLIQEKGGRCVDCGNDNPLVLQFDHRDPTTKVLAFDTVAFRSKIRLDEARAEAEKCDLRCANCHHLKTWIFRDHARARGTYLG